jgi:phage terminase large subunit-like protein
VTKGWREIVVELAGYAPEVRARFIANLSPRDVLDLDAAFEAWRHESQLPPAGEGWRCWLMQAGRGFGKTRAGAEWITSLATQQGRKVRIALVGATVEEARKVMVEGESGLLAVGAARGCRPRWEPSLGRLVWRGGSIAEIFSGENPDGLRGAQHHYAWCDELAKWAYPEAAWDNLQLGLRLGERPRALVTTTPRPIALLRRLAAEPLTVITRGRTEESLNLSDEFIRVMTETYAGTRFGRQELDGELIEEVAGALWSRTLIEACRGTAPQAFERILVGVDPPAGTQGDACGIVVCGRDADGIGHVLADCSVTGLSPEGWADAVAGAAARWGADCVVAETNQGGDMVASVLRGADCVLPVRGVRARYGKGRRAEPVAHLFERRKARFVGGFPALEDQLCGLTRAGYEGPGRSPDRADAMVWALAELMLGERREPRLRRL